MALGAFLPLVVFGLIAGSVGVRLVRVWLRTRAVPEGSLGLGLVLVTASLPLSAAGRVPALATTSLGRACFAAGLLVAGLGLCATIYFDRFVFRRESRAAGALFAVLASLVLASVVFMGAANAVGEDVAAITLAMRPGTLTLLAALFVAFAWGALESFLGHAAARRRLALGLADPVVVDRFLLWGAANAASAALLVVLAVCVASGMVILREPLPLSVMAASGLVMSACWSLTFFTPARYRRLVIARAQRHMRAASAPSPAA